MHPLGILRPIATSELELMRSWRNAPSVRAHMYTRHEISAEEHHTWWERTQQKLDQQYFMHEFSGKAAGIVGFSSIDHINGNCSWAFYAAPDSAKGTGPRMEMLAVDYAFCDLKMHKLYCEVLSFNTAVIKLHQKFGFKVEGIFREHHRENNTFVDIYRLGILSVEWSVQRVEMVARLKKQIRV
jgi:UDP-4-amino-4,6-dideoxy-N-acetyl-beta-L-altrosamine N-acetyltransferase